MFWVWIGVVILSVIVELTTTELISIWFTFGGVVALILSATGAVETVWQIVIFFATSALLLALLRKITMKFLLKNTTTKTNLDALVGQKYRMLERTDFETVGKLKVKDLEWSVVGENQQTIEKGAVVEVVRISGNKLVVKEAKQDTQENEKLKK